MADKFRKVFPVKISFVKGELPPSNKLNSLGDQTRNGLTLIEKAVGDIWNQSGDSHLIPSGDLFSNALYINSLGRTLGRQSFVSPRIPTVSAIAKYRDALTGTSGKTEAWLRYPPVPAGGSLAESDFTINTDTTSALGGGQFKTSPSAVAVNGDWHVTSKGKLITFKTMGTVDITYKPTITPDFDSEAQPNVVPDPYTDDTIVGVTTNFDGLKLSYTNDTNNSQGYWLYLPPRKPLTSARKLASSPSEVNNMSVASNYYFQDLTTSASSNAHFRYRFCKEVEDIISDAITASIDDSIPDNFLYLYDTSTGTIIEGLTFEADSGAPSTSIDGVNVSYVVRVKGSKLDAIVTADTSLVTTKANQAASAYKSRFKLVQPGASIARAISGLTERLFNHKHDNIEGSLPISHKDLKDLYDVNSPSWSPSGLTGDDHIQYLHRDGYNTTRDPLRNGMRGHLLLLQSDNTLAVSADSYRLYFGNNTKTLYFKQANSALAITGTNLELSDAGGKVQFEGTTEYIDKTRAAAYYNDIHATKVLHTALSKTTTAGVLAQVSAGSVSLTVPTGLTADVAITGTTYVTNNSGSNVSDVGITVSKDGGSPLSNSMLITVLNGAKQCVTATSIATGLTGAHTFETYCFSDGTHSISFTGDMSVVVTFRI